MRSLQPGEHSQGSIDALRRATGRLATAATTRMDDAMPWFRDLSAEERSWVGLIVQAGIQGFVAWYAGGSGSDLATSMFGVAPRTLAGAISLRQTVDLVRLSVDVVEAHIDDLMTAEEADEVHAAIARYAREVAFATAEVYARAAEARGAWDARLEALIVDAVLRVEADDEMLSRASALGWAPQAPVCVVLGAAPSAADRAQADLFEEVRRQARAAGHDALCAVQGDLLVVLLGMDGDHAGPGQAGPDPTLAARAVADAFGDGAVVVGPVVTGLASAHRSATQALAAYRAAPGWPGAARPAASEEFLAERVVAGDDQARRHLVEEVGGRLSQTLTTTLDAYFAAGGNLEATARALFVHVNTVRYRLHQVADITGLDPGRPRDALTLQLALIVTRL